MKAFASAYGAKFPKAVAKITGDEEELLAFYDYPAEHWIHLRTTNPIESAFATVRLRTKVTKGHGSKAAALAMAFKLIESAQRRRRMVNAPHLVALVRAGATFVNGKLAERPASPHLAHAAARRAWPGKRSRQPPEDLDPQVLTITPARARQTSRWIEAKRRSHA